MSRGILIALEGIDGSGTTTHSKLLSQWLIRQNLAVLLTHEPTGGAIGRLIRRRLRDSTLPAGTDALLFAADRLEHTLHDIVPALEQGKVVICDRYVESSVAYQSSAGLDIDWVIRINKFALSPELTILLDIQPDIGLRRKCRSKIRDKFEQTQFLTKVRNVFLARALDHDFAVINAELSIQTVQKQIQELVAPLLTRLK